MGCAQSTPAGAERQAPAQPVQTQAVQPAAAAVAAVAGKAAVQVAKEEAPLSRESPTSPLDAPGDDVCFKTEAEADRLQALLDCKCLDTVDERRFDTITSLLKEMFQVPMALVSLIDDDKLVFKSVAGTDCRQGDRLHSFCDASLRAPNPTMMVVPDTLEDARFCNSQFVKGEPHVRFYSGAPLVSSEGHVLGSLGIMDIKPRSFPAGALNVICNFAELVVREMERSKATAARAVAGDKGRKRAVRALSAFDEAVMLCNTAQEGWPLLYANQEWCSLTGRNEGDSLASSFWSLFPEAAGGAEGAPAAAAAAIAARRGFELSVPDPAGGGGQLVLELRPADRDHLSAAAPRIAIPNFVEGLEPAELAAIKGLYFAVARRVPASPQPAAAVGGDDEPSLATPPMSADHVVKRTYPDSGPWSAPAVVSPALHSFGLDCPEQLAGLELGPMLGRGAVGKVYRGTWPNQSGTVAVKIMEMLVDPADSEPKGPVVEALLSKRLRHPHVVETFDFAVRPVAASEPSWADEELSCWGDLADPYPAKQAQQQQQLWIVQQYCEHGTLGDAIDRGWLRHSRSPSAPPNMRVLLATAQEIAGALAYLHSEGVLHGDLTPANVLLAAAAGGAAPAKGRGARKDERGFTALVGDFGLARVLDTSATQLQTGTFGTVTHMPLELIQQQLLTRATDVFSFGVLLWEMYNGKRAWAGKSAVQILYGRTARGLRLPIPADWPAGFRALVEDCLADDHSRRPAMEEVQARLAELAEDE